SRLKGPGAPCFITFSVSALGTLALPVLCVKTVGADFSFIPHMCLPGRSPYQLISISSAPAQMRSPGSSLLLPVIFTPLTVVPLVVFRSVTYMEEPSHSRAKCCLDILPSSKYRSQMSARPTIRLRSMESSIFLGFLPSTDTTIQNVFFSGWPVVTCCFTLTEEAVMDCPSTT